MPIFFEAPRPAIVETVKTSVEEIVSRNHGTLEALSSSNKKPISFIAPHKIYRLSFNDIDEPGFLNRASLFGWRYLIDVGAEVVASAHWHYNDDGTSGEFSSIFLGIHSESTRKALELAQQLPALQFGHYQPHLLDCYPWNVTAVWLQHSGEDRSRDFYMPLDETSEPLVAHAVMRPDEFAKALVSIKERLYSSTTP